MSAIERVAADWSDWMISASWQLAFVACIVGLLVALLRGASPRLSYALWMLVLVKAFLPPTITSPWSVGQWVIDPMRSQLSESVAHQSAAISSGTWATASSSGDFGDPVFTLTLPVLLFAIWIAGAIALAAAVLWRYGSVARAVRQAPTIDEGPVRVAVEEISMRLGLRRVPEIHAIQETGSPFLLGVLTAARGRSPVAGGMIGVFEKGSKLQNRVERIMNYEPTGQRFQWLSRAAIVGLALFLLPMAPTSSQETTRKKTKPPKQASPYPQIVETIPRRGATDVDPGLDSITVKFDRDMGGGMSWTGGPPQMPPIDESRKAEWTDKRTCVLPVKLAKAKIYRVGINSKSYQNFRSVDGTPTAPDVIAFATEGASRSLQLQIRTPKITKISPANGATDVKPSVKALRVTFDVPMGGGMSWTGGGEHFPEIPSGQRANWSRDAKTCILPVKLKPDWSYRLGLNSLSHNNFQSKFGIPLKPVVYEFSTSSQ